MKNKQNWIFVIIIATILLIGGILRFYKLGDIPPGLTDDEVNTGYDAYSLLKTGKDQWGQQYPIFSFKGFGDYRSPVYTYLLLPLLPVFGMTPFWLKFPAAALGTITILLLYLIARKLGFSRVSAFMAAFFLAVNPWHIGMSRVAMVVVSGVFFLCMGMVLAFYAKKRFIFIISSFVSFALTIYAYPAYLVVTPLCLMFVSFIQYQRFQVTRKQLVIGFCIFLCITVPYLLSSQSSSIGVRMGQVNIFKDSGTIDLLNEKIGACQKIYPTLICKVTFNKYLTFGSKLAVNYVRHFSSEILFSHGTITQFSMLPPRGLLLSVEYFLFCIGIFYAILSFRNIYSLFLLAIILAAPIPDSVTGDGHYGRFFIILPFIQFIAAYGLGKLLKYFGRLILIPIVVLLLFETFFFEVEYFSYYPNSFSRYSHYGYEELVTNIYKIKDVYDEIYVSSRVNDAKQYIFYLFYTKFDPFLYQTDKSIERIVEPNGWIRVKKIENIYFVSSFPETDLSVDRNKKILYIGAPSEFPKIFIPSQFEIKDKKEDVIFRAVTLDDWERCVKESYIEEIK